MVFPVATWQIFGGLLIRVVYIRNGRQRVIWHGGLLAQEGPGRSSGGGGHLAGLALDGGSEAEDQRRALSTFVS